MDNRSKRRREKGKLLQDFSSFAVQYREQAAHKISPQLALATFQYLSSCMEPFKPEYISENVLRRLMQQSLIIRFIRVKNKEESKSNPATFLYQQVYLKPVQCCQLINKDFIYIGKTCRSFCFNSRRACGSYCRKGELGIRNWAV